MFERIANSLWESLVFPFTQLSAASERKRERRLAYRAQGLCSNCGAEPPLQGEDECYTCDEQLRGL
jgi:hypothetical protein